MNHHELSKRESEFGGAYFASSNLLESTSTCERTPREREFGGDYFATSNLLESTSTHPFDIKAEMSLNLGRRQAHASLVLYHFEIE